MRGLAELPTIGWLSDPEHWLSIAEPVALFHRIGWLRHPGIFSIKVFKIIFVVRINEKCSHNTIFALKIFIKIFQVVITLNNRVVNAGSILIYPANYIRINLL